MSKDYYQLLEINKTATPQEVQKAYRRLARKYHPDLNPDDKSAKQQFKDIQHAYDVLNDPEKRKMYDQFGPDFEQMGGGAHPGAGPFPGGAGGFEEFFGGGSGGAGSGGFGFNNLDELLQQFGANGRGRARSRGGATGGRGQRGEDLKASITVPFHTAVQGGTASITVNRGDKQESIQLRVPAGVTSGAKMRLRGQGNPGAGGAANGDLIVELTVAPHPYFQRQGQNLEMRLPITLKEAVIGATVDIPTPSGTVALKIPAGSSSGQKLRVKSQGVRDAKGQVGDLLVELQIKLPSKLRQAEQIPQSLMDSIEAVEHLYEAPLRQEIRW